MIDDNQYSNDDDEDNEDNEDNDNHEDHEDDKNNEIIRTMVKTLNLTLSPHTSNSRV